MRNIFFYRKHYIPYQYLGMVVYTGKETRMAMNTRRPRSKVGLLDMELNYLSKWLFVFMMILSVIMVFLNGINFSSFQPFFQFFRYLLLLSSIIPISMRVNLDFAKLTYSYKISMDQEIGGTIARNSVIPEELGRIQYLLTDKTGTLTQNDMIFKKLSLEQIQFTYETTDELQRMVRKHCEKFLGPMSDIDLKIRQLIEKNPDANRNVSIKKLFKREREFIVRDLITGKLVF
jgi:phospholipid-translocating ATPase